MHAPLKGSIAQPMVVEGCIQIKELFLCWVASKKKLLKLGLFLPFWHVGNFNREEKKRTCSCVLIHVETTPVFLTNKKQKKECGRDALIW